MLQKTQQHSKQLNPFKGIKGKGYRTGSTRTRDLMLRARGFRVLIIPFFEWELLKGVLEAQKAYLHNKMQVRVLQLCCGFV